ncbi:hypothetical protein PI125_g8019 [Phytophthora idaei]|nr:hypothetical protein PI125_g8019 [Phytophthora idaei]KAG3157161.1 hypothetical protein PI126_g8459 [Phytophthora idaei]
MDSHSGGKCPSSWPNNLNDLNDLNDHSDVSMRYVHTDLLKNLPV